jgi:hypothetical protein
MQSGSSECHDGVALLIRGGQFNTHKFKISPTKKVNGLIF